MGQGVQRLLGFMAASVVAMFFMLFSLQNDGSPSVTFQLRVRELKDMKILNSLRRLGDR